MSTVYASKDITLNETIRTLSPDVDTVVLGVGVYIVEPLGKIATMPQLPQGSVIEGEYKEV